jgi:subtilisin family serine protease
VAGIIAGAFKFPPQHRGLASLSAIAPQAKLHIYKVLDDEGQGDDAWIIKAIDHIASINEKAGGPEIAGVNLSLGGEFEQGVFGCGHTPLCDELRRLWRQGVVVVLAAGNEGFRRLMSSEGEFGANMASSIGDPANLEEAIAVGAVHKEKPHTYGVSHFSSRGPTADGRSKPDCVAPGEQILSCRHDPRKPKAGEALKTSDLYYKLDGTSMAAPHVSGLIACFLSLRREFIGQPDNVKRILLDNCTDLGRDRAMQGAGMPNLIKMLVQT